MIIPHRTVFLPEGVVRTISKDARRTRFTTAKTAQRLASEQAYRDEKFISLSSRRLKRRKKSFYAKAQDTESQLLFVAMMFDELAKQENGALCEPTADGDTERKRREAMRSEAMEIMRTTL